jgi:tetratricopeptide (TPR) repeat protein
LCFAFNQEKYDQAIDDCTKALELNPSYLKVLVRRAELYEKKDKLDEALVDYQKAYDMDRTYPNVAAACMVQL